MFAGILALVIGLAAGYMVLPSVFGKKLVDVNAKIGIKATAAPVPNKTEAPVNQTTPEPTDKVSPTSEPTAIPTPVLATDSKGNQIYTVQPGDTYIGIAQKVYGKASKYQIIMDANKSIPANAMKVGQKLIIPKLP